MHSVPNRSYISHLYDLPNSSEKMVENKIEKGKHIVSIDKRILVYSTVIMGIFIRFPERNGLYFYINLLATSIDV